MTLYRFADGDMNGPTTWFSSCDSKPKLDGILMSTPLRSLLQAAVYDIRCPYEDPGILHTFRPGRWLCACTPAQLEQAAECVDGEEFLMPPILWTLDVPQAKVVCGRDQAIINVG